MPGETPQRGIGAAFHINAETKAMRDMFSTLRNAGIQTIDPGDAHVTLVDCAETQIPVFSERDQLALNRARSVASAYLSTMPYHEIVLQPEDPRLEVFGRRLGILVANQDFLLGVRKYIGDIFQDVAGIELSNRSYFAHLSVGMKTRGAHAAAKRVGRARIPRQLHVVGHDVSERIFVEEPSRQRPPKKTVKRRPPGKS